MAKTDPTAIGFAVVGLGMGRHHCHSIRAARGAELMAICDVDAEKLSQTSEELQVRGYRSVAELLQDPEVDVVSVAVPTGLHAEVGMAAARAGKHVLCEKPLDVSVEKAEALIRACRDAGVKLGAIFQSRLNPLNRLIKQTIEEGRLGTIHYADAHLFWYRPQAYYAGGWHGTFALDGGGACMNQGIHSIDLLQWLVGPVRTVFGKTGTFTHQMEAEDLGTAVITFENGALGNITCTTSAYPGLSTDLHVCGSRGSIVQTDGRVTAWRIQHPEGVAAERAEEQEVQARFGGSKDSPPATLAAARVDGHTAHVEDMVCAIKQNRDPVIPGEQARHAIEIVNAIQKSAQTGREVELR